MSLATPELWQHSGLIWAYWGVVTPLPEIPFLNLPLPSLGHSSILTSNSPYFNLLVRFLHLVLTSSDTSTFLSSWTTRSIVPSLSGMVLRTQYNPPVPMNSRASWSPKTGEGTCLLNQEPTSPRSTDPGWAPRLLGKCLLQQACSIIFIPNRDRVFGFLYLNKKSIHWGNTPMGLSNFKGLQSLFYPNSLTALFLLFSSLSEVFRVYRLTSPHITCSSCSPASTRYHFIFFLVYIWWAIWILEFFILSNYNYFCILFDTVHCPLSCQASRIYK